MGIDDESEHWIRIGMMDSAGRRSLWFRTLPVGVFGDATTSLESVVTALEMCAGREGDDSYVRVERDDPVFRDLLDVLTTAQFAGES